MAKPDPSALTAAAQAFDDALAAYARLGDLFLRAPMDTLKHIERANATLNELADAEQRLQQTGQQMIAAIASSRDRQQALAQQIIDRAPALQERNTQLAELMNALAEIAKEVGTLNDDIAARPATPTTPTTDVSVAVLALSERAETLAQRARELEFPELGDQAHALYQRLQAIGKKLKMTGGN